MPKVKFKARTTAEIENLDIENGSLIYNTENGKTYLDYDNERISTGGGAGGGVATGDTPPENPEENDLWVDTDDDEYLAGVDATVSTTSTNAVQNQAITNYVNNAVKGTLLWTNSSPGNDFAEQTVQLDLTNYDTFDVYFRVVRNSGSVAYAKVLKNISTLLTGTQMYSASVVRAGNRAISISDTGISFGNGRRLTSFSAGEDNAATCIPVYVIGYKTGTVINVS